MPSPNSTWYLLQAGPGEPAANMAWDEALLEGVAELGLPVLRFYGWSQPAATFGYFQDYETVARLTSLRPLLRRPTGGGLVPHDRDWTYSICVPPGNPWYELKATESYRRVHEWVQSALNQLGVTTALAPARIDAGPGQCFVGAEQFDLVLGGPDQRKVAGAAQRRRKDGLLIQGSIQPGSLHAQRANFERACCAVATDRWRIEWRDLPAIADFAERSRELLQEKYSGDDYHRARVWRKSSCDPGLPGA